VPEDAYLRKMLQIYRFVKLTGFQTWTEKITKTGRQEEEEEEEEEGDKEIVCWEWPDTRT
jgi:hypothetical protein